eukprot:TRINITY_DN13158_c0_g1_i1.p2 TRINITY_DN13158_c0_g1~~TRINITY_DN13158_c0_g1_i1.p2  ORF type:complete len:121 (+),score=3.69 TRINITY_DN13158_c0_g1_i1:175-537(+)
MIHTMNGSGSVHRIVCVSKPKLAHGTSSQKCEHKPRLDTVGYGVVEKHRESAHLAQRPQPGVSAEAAPRYLGDGVHDPYDERLGLCAQDCVRVEAEAGAWHILTEMRAQAQAGYCRIRSG